MRKFKVNVNGVAYNVEVAEEGAVAVAAAPVAAAPKAAAPVAAAPAAAPVAAAPVAAPKAEPVAAAGDTVMNAPMPGSVSKILVREGQAVKKGDVILILEAMKMQNEMGSPVAGTVKSINVTVGESVKPGQLMALIG